MKANLRVTLDEHDTGWKFNDWEMRGVPVRVEAFGAVCAAMDYGFLDF